MSEKNWEEIYKQNWHLAYNLGIEARNKNLSNICNLTDKQFLTPSGIILKVYKSAWDQGYGNEKNPMIVV